MAATPLGRLFGKDDALARLRQHAARLMRLQTSLNQLIPRAMHGAVAVANMQDGVLSLHAATPALASRLNMTRESLLRDFQALGEPLSSIKIKVRPVQNAGPDILHAREERSIGAQGRQSLEALLQRTPADSPLAHALDKMLKSCA